MADRPGRGGVSSGIGSTSASGRPASETERAGAASRARAAARERLRARAAGGEVAPAPVEAAEAETYTHQVLDHGAVLAPVTKGRFRLTSETAGVVADKAVALATDPRCGPVHIDVPISAADAPASGPEPVRPAAVAVARSALAQPTARARIGSARCG